MSNHRTREAHRAKRASKGLLIFIPTVRYTYEEAV